MTRPFTAADFRLKLCKASKVQPLKRNKGFPPANALVPFWSPRSWLIQKHGFIKLRRQDVSDVQSSQYIFLVSVNSRLTLAEAKQSHDTLQFVKPMRNKPSWGLFLKMPGNFSGLLRVPQFPLYLRNAEALSHQTSQSSGFSYIKITLKDQLFKTSGLQFDNWLFGPEKFSGPSRNRPLDCQLWVLFSARQNATALGLNSTPAFKDQGPVSRKPRKLFGPEKPFVKFRPAYSVKLVFSHVVKGIKSKTTAKFCASRRLRFEDANRIMSPEMLPKSFGTFEKRAPAESMFELY